MRRSIQIAGPLVVLGVLIFAFTVAALSGQPSPTDPALTGRLATVEPSARRISLIPEGQAERYELMLAEDTEILQESNKLTVSELVIQVGSRVKVRYREENGVRIVRSITVEPQVVESTRLRVSANRPIPTGSRPRTRHAFDSGPDHTTANRRFAIGRQASA